MLPYARRLLATATAAALLACAPAQAADYWFLKANPALKPKAGAGGGAQAQPSITLAASILPDGMEGKAYSFDIKTLTQVTAGPGISGAQYAVGGGSLPTGISLSNDGMLAGTPTAVTAPEGASFTVVGTYETKTGQQVYTIKVGESVLEVTQIATNKTPMGFTCAVTTAGAAKCWGINGQGQLGDGTTTNSSVPVQVSGLTSGVTSIVVGNAHTCVVTTVGAARCWGNNSYGQLGDGTTINSSIPVQVSGLAAGGSSIAAGSSHSCAVVSGAAKCWGYNTTGQLGDGTTTNSSIPVQVTGLTAGVTSIAAGSNHACAVVSGAAWCWGGNGQGQLGDGTMANATVPVQVSGLAAGVSSLVAGSNHACAVVSGAAKCWGNNSSGQLGDGTTTNSSIPVQVSGLTAGVTSISAGSTHTCAVVSGAATCWGNNTNGQLGDGTTTASSVPVQVTGLASGVASIAGGYNHTCAVVSGAAKCWGFNGQGRLGNGTTTNSTVPVAVKAGN